MIMDWNLQKMKRQGYFLTLPLAFNKIMDFKMPYTKLSMADKHRNQ